jgi:hypothetical protein
MSKGLTLSDIKDFNREFYIKVVPVERAPFMASIGDTIDLVGYDKAFEYVRFSLHHEFKHTQYTLDTGCVLEYIKQIKGGVI